MAGLHFAALLAASSFGVLLLATSASASRPLLPGDMASSGGPHRHRRPPAVFFVGDEWRAASSASNHGTHHHQTLGKWALKQRFYVGDVLDFKRSNDTVLLVRRGDYERCSAASPARRFFSDGGDTRTRFTLPHRGLFYFISGAPARCEAGQRMVVRARSSLGGGGAPTPAPVPAPGTMEPDDVDKPSDDRPIPVWFKLFVPAVIGFIGGFALAGVIIWLCYNLRRRGGGA